MLGKFISHCEDSLTASVFTHLLHLPAEVFWRLLRQACYTTDLPETVGEPVEMDVWPKWSPDGTGNNTYVEPDVFIRFRDFDLIIEAKRWDERQQQPQQWRRELIAYGNEYRSDGQPVRMIALGGIDQEHDDKITVTLPASDDGDPAITLECPVHMCRWRGILYQCNRMLRELERQEYASSQTAANRRVLEHVIDLFAWHSYSTRQWFADVSFDHVALSRHTESHQKLFQNLRPPLLSA